jgi:aminoglycoside/choline kinase family phosphotransferase
MAIDENTIRSLLIRNKISSYKLEQIKSDASFREYYRVLDKNLLIMYAPKDRGESLVNFERINKILSSINLSVSKIYDADYQNDLLLIEDFGNDIYSKKLNSSNEKNLYEKAIHLLSTIHNHSDLKVQNLNKYNFEILLHESELFIEWYLEKHLKLNLNNSEKNEFQNILEKHFNSLTLKQNNLVLRDFHVDNLIYLNDRDGIHQLGLIDYQDALIGSSVYDFVSLIEDVRHPIKNDLKNSLIEMYSKLISVDQNELKREISFYSIQRNLKIVGIFSRLKYRDDKKNYFPMIEVALGFIKNHLKNNEYKDLSNWMNNIINNSL